MSVPAIMPQGFVDAAGAIRADLLTTDAQQRAEYGRDWTRLHTPAPCAVAFPRSTAEVSALLALCSTHDVKVVPSGGRTGLAGGAVAAHGELVVSLGRMNRMDPVDAAGMTVRVQAGAVTEAVHQHCAPAGLTWPVDFASKGSSQVGGNIATNAGGVRVIRWGLTRQWVLGLQVVLADGRVLDVGGALEKNNTGLDLRQLFIGSEGTLGIITEATLKLARLPGDANVLMFHVADVAGVLRLFRSARAAPFVLNAFEFMDAQALARLARHRGLRSPFGRTDGCHVLVEVEAQDSEPMTRWLETVLEDGTVQDGTLAQNPRQAQELWALREGISESLSATGLPHKNDVALPVAALEPFCAELSSVFGSAYPRWEICLFGHIGDGNLHINVMKPDAMGVDDFKEQTSGADQVMFALVQKHAGSISAEHGIGLLKRPYLHFSRSDDERALQRAIKAVLDPKDILNPGKVLA